MKHKRNITIGITLLVAGIAIGYYFGVTIKATKNFDWKELSLDPLGKGYGFSSEALFNSDIPLPEIKKLSGKSKFLKPTSKSRDEDLSLGYIVKVDVDKLDLRKVPEKYKVEKKEKYKAGEFVISPPEEVVYSVTFKFQLKDKDGFEMVKLKSPSHNIYSGKVNTFQDVLKQPIPRHASEKTSSIVLSMTVEKCETCK